MPRATHHETTGAPTLHPAKHDAARIQGEVTAGAARRGRALGSGILRATPAARTAPAFMKSNGTTPAARTGMTSKGMTSNGLSFHHPVAFWLGCLAVVAGVLMHMPMFAMARMAHWQMAGMPMDSFMLGGMALIVIGLLILIPSGLCTAVFGGMSIFEMFSSSTGLDVLPEALMIGGPFILIGFILFRVGTNLRRPK